MRSGLYRGGWGVIGSVWNMLSLRHTRHQSVYVQTKELNTWVW